MWTCRQSVGRLPECSTSTRQQQTQRIRLGVGAGATRARTRQRPALILPPPPDSDTRITYLPRPESRIQGGAIAPQTPPCAASAALSRLREPPFAGGRMGPPRARCCTQRVRPLGWAGGRSTYSPTMRRSRLTRRTLLACHRGVQAAARWARTREQGGPTAVRPLPSVGHFA